MEVVWAPHCRPYLLAPVRSLDAWKSDKSRSFRQHFPGNAEKQTFCNKLDSFNHICEFTQNSPRHITRNNQIKEMWRD